MSTYYEYQDVGVMIAHKLMKMNDWKVYGYHADESDSITDYYSPAYWNGVAEKNGYILCVNVHGASKPEEIRKYNYDGKLADVSISEKIKKLQHMTVERGASETEAETARNMIVKLQAKQQDRTKVIERINKAIDSTQNKINKLSGDYKTNTYKRMREQEGREAKIQGFKLDLDVLSYLLNVAQERELTFLEMALIIESFRNDIHAYYITESERPSSATPVTYPEKDLNYPNSWWNEEVPKQQKRLQKANISNTEELIEAIKEYKTIIEEVNKPQDQTELKIKRLERECKMMQKGDINFTPSKVAKRLIELARIEKGDKILEPSAGIGSITDEIRKTTTNIDVVERMADFRELLLLKGYNLVGYDFLEYQSKPIYDAIIMNPPFSDEQNHIKHAYEMLKEGGTLVAISSPHWTFASDKKSVEFRNWLENETYFTEDLESGTFEMTNVSSKIIVIEKHIQAETRTT